MGAGAVFISYRREDSEGQARALSIQLGDLIGRDSVFMDVDSIALGRDFRQVLQERLQACDIVLVLIGPNWLEAKDSAGNRRLENPADFVRQEIAAALKRNIAVTPVLLQGANMPRLDRLPPDLQDLAYRHGYEISHARWVSDVKEMFKRLGLMPRTNPYQVSMGRQPPSSPFAAAVPAAQPPAATDKPTPTTSADSHDATGSNAGNAGDPVAPAGDFSKCSALRGKQMRWAIIAAAGVLILAVLTLAGYISMRKKTTDTVAASTFAATTVPATTVPVTTVPATIVPATNVPAAAVAGTTVPTTIVPEDAAAEITVLEVTVPEISKMQREDAEAKVAAANLKAVVVKEWNQDAEQDSVIGSEPPPGTNVNPGDTVTLHVSAPGGWVHLGKDGELEAGKTFAMTKSMSLHVVDDKKSRQSGSAEAGKSVRVIEVGGHGWAKVVVTD